ncbi:lectin like domain-containing protein [Lagierella sp.]|uniref:lectin like domain-containing protein n=1 Tax=Lagierella sp. TaxID=2849657 RepID=UPI002602BCD1|nr:lectin like domain-containing protein [Lagierella sp.]
MKKLTSFLLSFLMLFQILVAPVSTSNATTLELNPEDLVETEAKNEEPNLEISPLPNGAEEVENEDKLEVSPNPNEIVENLEIGEAPKNPDFNKVSNSGSNKNFGLMQDPFKVNTNYQLIDSIDKFPRQKAPSALPSRYDLRNYNRVTPVKNQGPNGSCWAFATYGSAESVLMPTLHDFSEKHLRNTHGFDWAPDQGGTSAVAAAYLARWSGPVDEALDPYSPYDFRSPLNLPTSMELKEVLYIPDVRNTNDRDRLKRAIMDYGAAYTTINGNEYYTNFRNMAHYNNSNAYQNHAVTIVGWDDSYSRYNFGITPPGDGAWIVKNSWGPHWGNAGGYYYVSYYDNHCSKGNAIFVLKNKEPQKTIWYHDPLGMTQSMGSGNTGWFANVFGPVKSNQKIDEVGFFVPSNNASYEVYINTNFGGNSGFNNRVRVASGSLAYAGYYTVKFNPQTIPAGAYFSPIIKLTTPGYNYPIPVESRHYGYSSRANSNYGQSYISFDGSNWQDIARRNSGSNVCVKAFTKPAAGYVPPVEDVKVREIRVNNQNITLNIGDTEKLDYEVLPREAKNKNLNFTSSNPSVASVDRSGNIKALREGSTTITLRATDGSNKFTSVNVTVKSFSPTDIKVREISLSPREKSLNEGENFTITATVSPYNATNRNLNWSSSNPAVANVDNGKVIAKSAGTTTITASATDGSGVKGYVNVNVAKRDNSPNKMYLTSTVSEEVVTLGRGVSITSNVKNSSNYNLRYATITTTVETPSGRKYIDNKYTDYYGNATYTLDYSKLSEIGTYNVSVMASGGTFEPTQTTLSFEVKDSRPTFETKLTLDKTEIFNTEYVKLNIQTLYGNYRITYADVDILIETPDGYTHKANFNSGYYASGTYNYTPGKTGAEGVYKIKIISKRNGYRDSIATGEFKVKKSAMPEDFKLTYKLDKDSYKYGEKANIYFNATANDGRYISGMPLQIDVKGPDNFSVDLSKTTDYYGRANMYIQPNQDMKPGEYTITVIGQHYYYGAVKKQFSVNFESTETKDVINLEISCDKKNYNVGEKPTFKAKLTDSKNNAMTGSYVTFSLMDSNDKEVENRGLTTFASGELTFIPYNKLNAGTYTLKVTATKYGYEDVVKTLSITVGEDSFEPSNPDGENFYKMVETDEGQRIIEENKKNSNFVLLDVRTNAEFLESHIEGATQYDYYKDDFKEFLTKLDPNKTYLIYCRTQVRSGATAQMLKEMGFTKIYWMNGGMTKWLRESRPSIMPEYDKTLDLEVVTDKSSYRPANSVLVSVNLTDLENNGIRKGSSSLEVFDSKGNKIANTTLTMDDYGKKDWKFNLPFNSNGQFKIVATASHKDYKPAKGLALFTVGSSDGNKFLSFNERNSKGQFSHLKKTDFEYESLVENYGKNILKYEVKDNKLKTRQIADLVEPGKKTVIVFGYPGCGPCVDMWKAMSLLAHEEYNFIEVVTSVEEDVKSTIDFTDTVIKDQNIDPKFKDHIYYDAVDTIWGSRLDFLTTPNTVLLDENGRLVNISGALDAKGLLNFYKKTFGEEINIDEQVNEKALKMDLQLDQDTVEQGGKVLATVTLKDYKDNPVSRATVRYTVTNPNGREFYYDRMTDSNGQCAFTIYTARQATLGKYNVVVSYNGSDYDESSVSSSFNVGNKSPDNPAPTPDPDPRPDPNPPKPDPDYPPTPDNSLTYSQREANEEFRHISSNDLGGKLRNVYGTNVNNYSLTDLNGYSKTISSITDGRRPTVIAFGYPSCGGCQGSWRYLVNIDKSQFNMIEAMTTNSSGEVINTLSRLGLSQMQPYFYTNGRTMFNLVNSNYVPMLMYLDKDGNITNLSYFNSNSEVLSIVNSISTTTSRR